MPFQVSPGINVSEIDLTTVVPNVATAIGAIAGAFQWGPVLQRTRITTENDLVRFFGKPNDLTSNYFVISSNKDVKVSSNLRVSGDIILDSANKVSSNLRVSGDVLIGEQGHVYSVAVSDKSNQALVSFNLDGANFMSVYHKTLSGSGKKQIIFNILHPKFE